MFRISFRSLCPVRISKVREPEAVLRHVGRLGFSDVEGGRRRGVPFHLGAPVRDHRTAADVAGRGRHLEAAFLLNGLGQRLDEAGDPHHVIDDDHRVVGRAGLEINIECLSVWNTGRLTTKIKTKRANL